jgi:hypothetical protein
VVLLDPRVRPSARALVEDPAFPFFALFSGVPIHELVRLVFLFISVSSDLFNMVVEVGYCAWEESSCDE